MFVTVALEVTNCRNEENTYKITKVKETYSVKPGVSQLKVKTQDCLMGSTAEKRILQ